MITMTDSEEDIFQNNVLNSQNISTLISAKGPNNSINMSFHNKYSSAINMPRNFNRPHYAESAYDQRSVYSRREVSPSTSSLSYYRGGMGSQRSVNDRRGGSPMSMRTIDSNTSASAMYIATELKANNFNKYELRILTEACSKFLKSRQRRRIEKRRNRRYNMKGGRYRSGGESGEEGSDSSVSGDDCRSTKSYRSNLLKDSSSCRSTRTNLSDFRRTMQDSNMYRDCTENFRHNALKNMFCLPPRSVTESSQSKPPSHSSSFMTQRERFKQGYLLPSQRFDQSTASQSIPEIPQRHKDFDMDVRSDIIRNNNHMANKNTFNSSSEREEIFERTKDKINDHNTNTKRILDDCDINVPNKKRTKISPQEQMTETKSKTSEENKDNGKPSDFVFAKPQFPVKKITSIKNVVKTNSRVSISIKKTPVKQIQNTKKNKTPKSSKPAQKANDNANCINENYKTLPETKSKVCAKPVTPRPVEKLISKSKEPVNSLSPRPVEKLISKSKQPLDSIPNPTKEAHQEADLTQFSNTDISMRPSFIKRKLFSQKTDLADNKNSSSDNIEAMSPSNIYSAIQKEKNRTRKLVTSQSCLNYDVLGDESNLIDLIHKIVPANRLNITAATNKIEIANKPVNTNKPANGKKRQDWDISTVIASCSNDDVSDTYTDEEIFKTSVNDKTTKFDKTKMKENNNEPVKTVEQTKKDLIEPVIRNKAKPNRAEQNKEPVVNNREIQKQNTQKLQTVLVEKLQPHSAKNVIKTTSGSSNGCARSCVKSFWDITSDSDIENTTPVKQPERALPRKETTKCTKVQKEQQKATSELANVTNVKQTKPNKNKDVGIKNDTAKATKVNEEVSPNGILSKDLNSKQTKKDLIGPVIRNKAKPGRAEQNKEPVVNNGQIQKQNTQKHPTVLLEKLQPHSAKNVIKTTSGSSDGCARSCVKSFWDITSDSDIEHTTPVKQPERAVPQIETTKCTKNDTAKATKVDEDVSPNDILSKDINSKQNARNTATNLKHAKQNTTTPTLKKNKDATNTMKKSNVNSKEAVKNQASANKVTNKPAKMKSHMEKIKINNNTLRLRTCRTPKNNRCCLEPSTTEDSLTDTTLYMSLRSRAGNLSTTLKSDVSLPKKTLASKLKRNITKKKDTSLSDVSFTLALERMSKTQNNITNIRTRPRRGDISLTFTPEKNLNRTMTRSRNTKTVENSLDVPNIRPKRSICNKTNTSISQTKNIPKVEVSKTRK